jgi:hypothetical protein
MPHCNIDTKLGDGDGSRKQEGSPSENAIYDEG